MTHLTPTPEQASAIDAFKSGCSTRINAYAGTGKTSTLALLSRATDKGGTYLAFNKSIADEAGRRFPGRVSCSTTHSLAFRAIRKRGYGSDKMTNSVNGGVLSVMAKLPRRVYKLTKEDGGNNSHLALSPRQYGTIVAHAIASFCRSDCEEFEPWHAGGAGRMRRLTPATAGMIAADVIKDAAEIWERMKQPGDDIPLGHDGYLKLWSQSKPRIDGDFILLDEAQDTNGVVMGIMRQQAAQLVCVGDRWQSIYGWRGARNAMVELPCDIETRLSTSFRFGENIASNATRVLRMLGESVPLIGNPKKQDFIGDQETVDTILFRTNGEMIAEVLEMIENGHRPAVVGGVGDLVKFIEGAARLIRGIPVDYPIDLFGFQSWNDVQEFAETEEGQPLERLVDMIDSHGTEDLIKTLLKLPRSENDATIVLTTGHKAKGREWSRVRLHDDFMARIAKAPSGADQERAKASFRSGGYDDELQLLYVAATRAMDGMSIAEDLLTKMATLETYPSRVDMKIKPTQEAA